ncbi:hypothetical protein CPB83DRAFT_548281 [Crepidotus variabilis]|uniref:Uncharacterized protein n=1 Tax=Crepidotus variabilis TaxID=179855 RepID=A0A9P6E9T4_9AGAR|nr:hypothetical protein CPB83DRAFT_548281 [Crepidotus variabilis]
MAPPKTYTWISLWFLLSHTIDAWDIAYILLRPHSLPGSQYRWIWKPYDDLEIIDKNYDVQRFYEGKSTGLAAKAVLSIAEVLSAVIYLYKAHVSKSSSAPLYGYTSALATILKCALWTLEEVYCGWCTVGHNDTDGFIRAFVGPMSYVVGILSEKSYTDHECTQDLDITFYCVSMEVLERHDSQP